MMHGFPDMTAAKAAAGPRRVIMVSSGILSQLASECENALISSGLPIFQRGTSLVRPMAYEVAASDERTTTAAGLKQVTTAMLVDLLSDNVDFQRFDARTKKMVACDPPAKAIDILLSRAGLWKFQTVLGVITAPTLRRDGSIVSDAGYDPATRLYMVPDASLKMPAIPERPTLADAEKALKILDDLLEGFPFCSDIDRAVALSGIVSPVVRGALGMVPLHAFTAPAPGTGKSYIADVVSAIVSGRICPVATAGKTEEETEKRLGGLLMAGFPVIAIDNISSGLGGDLLCQVIERPIIRIRPLGKSEIIEIESRATVYANGNNLVVEGDMTRRTLLSKLDAKVERPEERTFKFDPVARVLSRRGDYIAAALTVVRAYMQHRQPGKLSPLQSFGAWSDNVRSALVWLGKADPAESIKEVRASDPVLATLAAALEAWQNVFPRPSKEGEQASLGETAQEVAAELASFDPTTDDGKNRLALRNALFPVANVHGVIDSGRLGRWLRKSKGRPVKVDALKAAFKFEVADTRQGFALWCVMKVDP
jgi:putative DNA primase/helicase